MDELRDLVIGQASLVLQNGAALRGGIGRPSTAGRSPVIARNASQGFETPSLKVHSLFTAGYVLGLSALEVERHRVPGPRSGLTPWEHDRRDVWIEAREIGEACHER